MNALEALYNETKKQERTPGSIWCDDSRAALDCEVDWVKIMYRFSPYSKTLSGISQVDWKNESNEVVERRNALIKEFEYYDSNPQERKKFYSESF